MQQWSLHWYDDKIKCHSTIFGKTLSGLFVHKKQHCKQAEMKKAAATILVVLYLVTSTGATIHTHYCMGQLKVSGLWHSSKKKGACTTCGMAKKKGCCEDKYKAIKIEKQYDSQSSAISLAKLAFGTHSYNALNFTPAFIPASLVRYPLSASPPGIHDVALYISYCVYRI